MSFKSGDRARADKHSKKRRVRRSQMRLLRKVSTPTVVKPRAEQSSDAGDAVKE